MTGAPQSKRGEADDETVGEAGGETGRLSGEPLPAGLYLAATPIGAANDVTLRALDALARADAIAAEDTRRAAKLMMIHGIKRRGRPMIPYHDHNGAAQRPALLRRIAGGEAVVCVTDAGTPLVADPGWKLAHEAIELGLPVHALPGASAMLTALMVAGLPTDKFLFAGFPPPKSAARRAEFAALATTPATLIFYESPRRLGACLADMAAVLGGEREAAVSRELTKRFEETRRGTLDELAEAYAGAPPKGEIVITVGPPLAVAPSEDDIDAALEKALEEMSVKDAAKTIAATFATPRKIVYARALELSAAKRALDEN